MVAHALTIQEIEGGFPHSEIPGSKLVRSSPGLIAAYHVLHRLSAPRHPPNALKALDRSHDRCPGDPCGSRGHGHKKTSGRILSDPAVVCLPNAPGTAAFTATRTHSLFTMSNIRAC